MLGELFSRRVSIRIFGFYRVTKLLRRNFEQNSINSLANEIPGVQAVRLAEAP